MLTYTTSRIPVPKITQSLKRFTAQEANRILSLTGNFWQPERYDRLVRSHTEFHRIANYIEMNSVKAGFVHEPEDYPLVHVQGRLKNRPQVETCPTGRQLPLGAGFAFQNLLQNIVLASTYLTFAWKLWQNPVPQK